MVDMVQPTPRNQLPVGASSRRSHWVLWLAVGVLAGLGLGFLAGLAKPRIRTL